MTKIKLHLIFLIVITSFTVSVTAQTAEQVKKKLESEGITTAEQIKAELQKRNMTEDDARKLATQYGISYDDFIATYITGGMDLNTPPPQVTNVKPILPPAEPKEQNVTKAPPKEEVKTETLQKPETPDNKLEFFGYNLFKDIPQSFEPAQVGPIDPGYVIGPGDVLQLYVWGAVELQYQLPVDIQGNVFIPTAGQFFVSGIAYKDLQPKLINYLSKFYEGLKSDPPTVFLDITLAKLRPIRIFVLGEVARPGGYNISSYATVFNAIYSVGGPLTSGSLRDIRVIRNNKLVTKVDLYDYLLNGALTGDVRLQNNDMIFIPPRGKTVSIDGEVFRPAIYELKDDENLQKLIAYAGKLKSTAYTGRANIERIIPFNERKPNELERKVIDVDLSKIIFNPDADFPLFDKDIVKIFPILTKVENYVKISGAVYRPGTFELDKTPSVADLVKKAYGLLPEAYLGKADVIRTRPDLSQEFITFDLGKALDREPLNNVQLQPMDEVKIYSVYDLKDKHTVSIAGYVKNPISIEYADSLTLYDMVFKAGKWDDPMFTGRAYLQRGDVIRFNPDGITTKIIPFDLKDVIFEKKVNFKLEPGDKIYIYKADVDKVLDKVVRIEGEVKNPGSYPLNTNMTVMDLIIQAGGFLESSLKTEAYVNRIRPEGFTGEKLSETFTVKLPESFTGKLNEKPKNDNELDGDNFYLQHRDVVVVRRNVNWEPQRTVVISGEVKKPGVYALKNKNETLLDLLNEAGGPTSEAFLLGANYKRGNKRVVLNLEKIYYENDLSENIILNDGDQILIPKIPNTILVTGEVNNPGLYKYIEGESVKDYIDKAGGERDSADFILYQNPTGLTRKVGFGLFSSNPEVLDGSIINVTKVPYEPEGKPVDIAATIKDVLSIIVSAVTIIVLANR